MNLDTQSIKIFIINLRESEERRSEMIRKMDSFGLEYEFFEAVDGRELSEEFLTKIRNQPYSFKKAFGREMKVGEIGCAMSHLKVYKAMVETQIDVALILEDDIDFDERLQFVLENGRTKEILKNNLDLVLFGYSADGIRYQEPAEVSIFKKQKIGVKISFCLPTVWNWSTIGYLISNSGAKKLLAQGEFPRIPADFLTANSPKYGVRLGITNKPLIWPGELNNFSHIGPGRGHPNETKPALLLNDVIEIKKVSFGKRIYANARLKYHHFKRFFKSKVVKVNPGQYLYVSDRF